MPSPKQAKLWFMTDELLRVVQIVAVVMAIGVFVDTTRETKATNAAHEVRLRSVEMHQTVQSETLLRTVELLGALEKRMQSHEIEASAAIERLKRVDAAVDKITSERK